MAVPNVSNFSFWDVADEIYGYVGGGMSLEVLFADANSTGFVTAYAGAKDRLSNFRGYSHGGTQYAPTYTTFQASSFNLGAGNNQCNEPYSIMRWHNGTGQGPSIGDTVYWSNGGGYTDSNVFRKYIPSNFVEVPRTYGTDSNGVVDYLVPCS